MGLPALIKAANDLEEARDRIQALKDEKTRLQARIDAVNAELASARADADAAIAAIRAEAPGVAAP